MAKRARIWTFVVYPDSAPENWRKLLDEQHVQWVESPLHDSDLNADGEVKKAHWHVMVLFSGVKTYDQAKELADLCHAPIPQAVKDKRSMTRYFAHMDNPEKHQYSPADIVAHGGADISDDLMSKADRYALITEMIKFCIDNQVTDMIDLLAYAMENESSTWLPLLYDNSAYIVNLAIQSIRNKLRDHREAAFEAKKRHHDAALSPRKKLFGGGKNDDQKS